MVQSGISFAKMGGRSLRKAVTPNSIKPVQIAFRTKGKLKQFTIMPVVSAFSETDTPIIVFPGKQAQFHRDRGMVQTVHKFSPPHYFYQRDIRSVESDMWTVTFVVLLLEI